MSLPPERSEAAASYSRYSWAGQAIPRGLRVADVGCGIGFGTDMLATRHIVVGIDASHGAIEEATRRFRSLFIVGNAEAQSFRGFDAVVCLETISHMIDPAAWLKRLDVPRLIVSAPTTPSRRIYPWRKHDIPEPELREMIEPKWIICDEFRQHASEQEQYVTLYAQRPD